ncbi:MAG: hypothetical protein OEY61_09620 [Gammaproteobacteria bacterium]|nr:hypothetical protein [Gammaproteobacteria bacterium]
MNYMIPSVVLMVLPMAMPVWHPVLTLLSIILAHVHLNVCRQYRVVPGIKGMGDV